MLGIIQTLLTGNPPGIFWRTATQPVRQKTGEEPYGNPEKEIDQGKKEGRLELTNSMQEMSKTGQAHSQRGTTLLGRGR